MASVIIVGAGLAGQAPETLTGRIVTDLVRTGMIAAAEDAEREFWATEDDRNVPVREEEIAEPLEETAGGVR